MKHLRDNFLLASVRQNESQARRDKFKGPMPGFYDEPDIWMEFEDVGIRLNFEITGDKLQDASPGTKLFFNPYNIKKLLQKETDTSIGFAVYYLSKRFPPRFYLMKAYVMESSFKISQKWNKTKMYWSDKYIIKASYWTPLHSFIFDTIAYINSIRNDKNGH